MDQMVSNGAMERKPKAPCSKSRFLGLPNGEGPPPPRFAPGGREPLIANSAPVAKVR